MQTPLSEVLADKGAQCYQCEPGTRVSDAVREMNQRNIGSMLVVGDGRLQGIFTERDVLVRIVDVGLDPATTTVQDAMTRDPITVSPATTVEAAMRIVTQSRCRHLPVVVDGRLQGVVSLGDLTRWLVRDQEQDIDDLKSYIAGNFG